MLNALGDSVHVTGLNMYVRTNAAYLQAGFTRIDDAPTIFDKGSFTQPTFAIDTVSDEVDVSFDNTDDWANEDDATLLVYASIPKAPTVNFFKGPYNLIGSVDGDSVTPPTSPAAIALTQAVTAGQRLFFKVVVIRADGRRSDVFRGQADAA